MGTASHASLAGSSPPASASPTCFSGTPKKPAGAWPVPHPSGAGGPAAACWICLFWIAGEIERSDGSWDHGAPCGNKLEPPESEHHHTAAHPRRCPGNGITSAFAAGPIGPTRVSNKPVDILPPLATANVASRQQLQQTRNPFRFVKGQEKARLPVD